MACESKSCHGTAAGLFHSVNQGENVVDDCVFLGKLICGICLLTLLNRSLERGLAVLECFRPGVGVLTHGDIADRTGLSKPTVTRLLATLREQGYVVFDSRRRGYQLGVPVLSLARTQGLNSELRVRMAEPIARIASATHSIIGFGTAHDLDIVYLEAFNGDPARPNRQVGPGMRAPIASTSVGRAWLAGLSPDERSGMVVRLSAVPAHWRPGIDKEIAQSLREVAEQGYCLVLSSEGRHAAIGTPVAVPGAPVHTMSIGYIAPAGRDPRQVPPQMLDAMEELRACALQ